MKQFIMLIPLILGFNYKPSLNDWEIKSQKIDARKISIRSGLANLKRQCDFEKNNKLFPVSCFELLKGLKILNPQFDHSKIESDLDKRCENYIYKVTTLNQVSQIALALANELKCKKLINAQEEIIKYKLEI